MGGASGSGAVPGDQWVFRDRVGPSQLWKSRVQPRRYRCKHAASRSEANSRLHITDVLWSRAPQALIKIVEEKPSTTGSDQDGALLCMPGIERSWLQPWRAEDDDLMAFVYPQ